MELKKDARAGSDLSMVHVQAAADEEVVRHYTRCSVLVRLNRKRISSFSQ